MKFADRVKQTTTATNTATVSLGAAVTGYRTLAQAIAQSAAGPNPVKVGDTLCVCVEMGDQWEVGLYTITSETLLTRQSIEGSSNNGAAVAFTAGSKEVFCTVPASYLTGLGVLDLASTATVPDAASVEWTYADNTAKRQSFADLVAQVAARIGSGTPAAATVTGVSVSPSTASLAGGASQTFTATVTGTNSPSQAVTWTASAGSITTAGAFTAPAATGAAQTITITATSAADTTKSGIATVTVAAAGSTVSGVTVSPSTATLSGAGTQTFTATVSGTNSPSQGVTWTASAGSITSGGVFTAPAATGSAQTVTVTATSTQDSSKSGTATVTVSAAPASTVTGVTVTPATATVAGNGTQTFTASVAGANSPAQSVTWSASAGAITSGGAFTAPAATSSAQTITITATSTQDATKSGTATVTVSAQATQTAYTITGYNGNTVKSTFDGSGAVNGTSTSGPSGEDATHKYFVPAKLMTNQYWNITPAPASVVGGWGLSSTQPPATITDNSNATHGNGMLAMNAATAPAWGTDIRLFVPIGSGTTGPWFFWIKPVDGAAQCMNAGAGLTITGT